MRVLLSEGSGLTSRQTATRLHALGHTVGVLSSDPIALTRFTRTVRSWHRVPEFGLSPFAWLDAAIDIVRRHRYDLLFPTQEQVTVLSWAVGTTKLDGVRTIVPPFESLRAVQDKISARSTLESLGIAQPPSTVLRDLDQLRSWNEFPVFIKTPIGTATSGVRRVDDRDDLAALIRDWSMATALGDERDGVLAQAPADGPLAMLQGVFDRGRLIAFNANLRTREGARGGASHKRSLVQPDARTAVETLGRELSWHGALSADVILTSDGAVVIDVNPRLVEPGNASRAGVDLVDAMLDAAFGRQASPRPTGRADVKTHQLLLAILGAAQHGGRRGIVDELLGAVRHTGEYADSSEELTPIAHDWRAALPCVAAAAATLVKPTTWEWFSSGSVASYAISPEGWRIICSRARPADPDLPIAGPETPPSD